ncbi:MAG: hypothetical protein FWE56_00620 [Candidatus Bathyarchaeota archaeon]|nr:hypothetical protein [Candidatus Termiticorpusculum sp.]MCL2868500.1 hypothetical protein [Candidatus Termiticorpusculum sp.]
MEKTISMLVTVKYVVCALFALGMAVAVMVPVVPRYSKVLVPAAGFLIFASTMVLVFWQTSLNAFNVKQLELFGERQKKMQKAIEDIEADVEEVEEDVGEFKADVEEFEVKVEGILEAVKDIEEQLANIAPDTEPKEAAKEDDEEKSRYVQVNFGSVVTGFQITHFLLYEAYFLNSIMGT